MCRIHNTIGSLTTLKSHLNNSGIYDFKSIREVIDFRDSYTRLRQELIAYHEKQIEQEKNILSVELQQLDTEIITQKQFAEQILATEINKLKQEYLTDTPSNIFQKIIIGIKNLNTKRKLKNKEQNFEAEVNKSIRNLVYNHQVKSNRYEFIASNRDVAIQQSVQSGLAELDRKKEVIENLNSFIYGAFGEQKVVKTLEALSDDYILINDFMLTFQNPIYNKQENDYIKSVQIDHILIGPSGVFLIETKNWSEKSLESLSLRSPVQQIKRTSFVLFKLLNNEISNYTLGLDTHHWGNKKVSIKNLIVLTNTKPKEEFQFVKILTVNELPGYVTYFTPTLSNTETQKIADFLLKINKQ